MSKVANGLLGVGEQNVQADLSVTSSPSSRARDVSDSGVSESPPALEHRNDESDVNEGAKVISLPSHRQPEESASELSISADGAESMTTQKDCKTPEPVSVSTEESAKSLTELSIEGSFEKAMADAEELEEKWFLTFEQFVSALQREPVLCQFFAEQNTIDLSGTNVDPVLNPYTRTILATSP